MNLNSAKMILLQPNETRAPRRPSPATFQGRTDLPPLNSQLSTLNLVRGFTLIELLVVISIIGVIAAFTFGVLGRVGITRKISTARGELAQIETALENYKAKYGVYPPSNQNPNGNYLPNNDRSQFNQLYYELSGTTSDGVNFTTLGGSTTIPGTTIPVASVPLAYGVGGFINCTKGSGEDVVAAKIFLSSLSSKQYFYPVTNSGTGTPIPTTILVTSVGGPDVNYLPLGPNSSGLNPVRYICPGTNNPSSYDLWVQLSINGKLYLVCNWSKAAQINTPYY